MNKKTGKFENVRNNIDNAFEEIDEDHHFYRMMGAEDLNEN